LLQLSVVWIRVSDVRTADRLQMSREHVSLDWQTNDLDSAWELWTVVNTA